MAYITTEKELDDVHPVLQIFALRKVRVHQPVHVKNDVNKQVRTPVNIFDGGKAKKK